MKIKNAENSTDHGARSLQDDLAEFWADLVGSGRLLPDKGLFLGLLIPWILLFHFLGNSTFGYVDTPSLFGWTHYVLTTSPDDQHGLLIPLVVVALFWWKRRMLLALPKANWWPALLLLLLAILLHILGFLVQQSRVSIVAFFLGVYALTGLVWGVPWLRASFFPMFLFAFCVPLGTLAETITFPLRMLVTKISVGITHGVLGMDVIREGTLIFDSRRHFQFDVAPACSGIRSLISLLALTTIYGFVTFQATWKRLLMMAIAVPLTVLGNVVRIVIVILVAEASTMKTGAMVEQKLGFITFAVAIGCVLGLGYLLKRWTPETRITGEAKAV